MLVRSIPEAEYQVKDHCDEQQEDEEVDNELQRRL
jgi:hypothetical protein